MAFEDLVRTVEKRVIELRARLERTLLGDLPDHLGELLKVGPRCQRAAGCPDRG